MRIFNGVARRLISGLGALVVLGGLVLAPSLAASDANNAWALDNGPGRTPPMGWSNWNSLGCNYTAATLEDEARRLVSSGLAADGYNYFRIQECNFEPTRDARGDLVPRPERFPDGLKPVVDYLHSLGLRVGIYTDSGTYTCAGPPKGGAGLYGHEQQDANYFAALGADYVEADWCNIPYQDFPGQSHEQVAKTLIGRMRDAIAVTGRKMFFYSFAGWDQATHVWQWGSKYANAWRTGSDINYGYGKPMSWDNVVSNFETNAKHPDQSGPGGFGDPDMLGVGLPGISDAEGQSMMSLWAIESAPLSIGTDLTNPQQFTDQTAATYGNREVIAIDQDPLGKQAHLVSDDGRGHQVWRKPLANGDVAVAFLNDSPSATTMSTTAGELNLPRNERYNLRDLWAHQTTFTAGRIAANVQSHQVTLYRVAIGGHAADAAPATDLTFDSSAPYIPPGGSAVITATLHNDAPVALHDATATPATPTGWQITALDPDGPRQVNPNGSTTWRWKVQAPANWCQGLTEIPVSATYRHGDRANSVRGSLPLGMGVAPTVSGRRSDTTTQGNWKGTYGSQGVDIVGDSKNLPNNVQVTTNAYEATLAPTSTDVRALQRASNNGRIAAALYANDSVRLAVNNSDRSPHRISLYGLDWGRYGKQVSITLKDYLGNQLDKVDSGSLADGKYFSWNVTGEVYITCQADAVADGDISYPYANVMSGIFVDPAS